MPWTIGSLTLLSIKHDFHHDLTWLEHEIRSDFEHVSHFLSHNHSAASVEHDVHDAVAAKDVSRAAAAIAASAVAVKETKGKTVKGLVPMTATSKAIAARPRRPSGFNLLLEPRRWSRASRTLLAGAVSGAASKTATAPIETVRIKLMANGGQLVDVVRKTFDAGGVAAFWKGNFVNVLRTIPTKSIQFAAFDGFKEVFKQTNPKTGERTLPLWGGSVSGALAGVVSTIATHPLETVQTRLAVGSYRGVADCVATMVKNEGVASLFVAGLAPSLAGIIPYSGINLGAYDAMRQGYVKVTGQAKVPTGAAFVMGSVAGCTAATICFPLEVVRRRMMMGAKFKSTAEALVAIANAEGWRALFTGAGLNWLKMAPASGSACVLPLAVSILQGEEHSIFHGWTTTPFLTHVAPTVSIWSYEVVKEALQV